MEENENEKVEAEVVKENVETTTEPTQEVNNAQAAAAGAAAAAAGAAALKFGILRNKKRLVICIIALVVVIVAVYNIFFNMKGKAKSTIKTYLTSMGSGKYVKAMKQVDPVGAKVFSTLDKDEYEDFWKDYKEFKKSDEYDDLKEEWEETLEQCKEEEEDFEKDDKTTYKIKEITKFEKVGDHLYEVKAKIESKHDGDEKESTYKFYVMKDGLGCKLVSAGL